MPLDDSAIAHPATVTSSTTYTQQQQCDPATVIDGYVIPGSCRTVNVPHTVTSVSHDPHNNQVPPGQADNDLIVIGGDVIQVNCNPNCAGDGNNNGGSQPPTQPSRPFNNPCNNGGCQPSQTPQNETPQDQTPGQTPQNETPQNQPGYQAPVNSGSNNPVISFPPCFPFCGGNPFVPTYVPPASCTAGEGQHRHAASNTCHADHPASMPSCVAGLQANESERISIHNADGESHTTRTVYGCNPITPTGLTVDCAAQGDDTPEVTVAWDAAQGSESYEVEGDLTYTGVDTSFTEDGERANSYRVRVRAYNSGGTVQWSGWSGYAQDTCPAARPTGVVVECSNGYVTASWTDTNDPPVNDYTIFLDYVLPRAEFGTSYNSFGRYSSTTTTWVWPGIWSENAWPGAVEDGPFPLGTEVDIRVVPNTGNSPWSFATSAVCVGTVTSLTVDCAVPAGSSTPTVTVSWDALDSMTGYEAEGSLSYSGSDTSFTANGAFGQSYTVRVRATDGTTTTGWSDDATDECPPTAPAITTAECVAGDLEVRWTVRSTATSYEIELDDPNIANSLGNEPVVSSGRTTPAYTDAGLAARKTMNTRVRAASDSGNSPWSTPETVECEAIELTTGTATLTADTTPVYSRAVDGTLTRTGSPTATFDFDLEWTAVASTYGCAVNGYEIDLYEVTVAVADDNTTTITYSEVTNATITTVSQLVRRITGVGNEGLYAVGITPTVTGDHADCGAAAALDAAQTDPVPQGCAAFVSWEYGEFKEVIGNDLCGTTGSIGDNSRADDADDGDTLTSEYECTVTSAMSDFDWLLDNADGDDDSTNDPGGFYNPYSGTGTPCGLYGRAPRKSPPPEGWTTGALDYQVEDSDGDTAENTISVEVTAPWSGYT